MVLISMALRPIQSAARPSKSLAGGQLWALMYFINYIAWWVRIEISRSYLDQLLNDTIEHASSRIASGLLYRAR